MPNNLPPVPRLRNTVFVTQADLNAYNESRPTKAVNGEAELPPGRYQRLRVNQLTGEWIEEGPEIVVTKDA